MKQRRSEADLRALYNKFKINCEQEHGIVSIQADLVSQISDALIAEKIEELLRASFDTWSIAELLILQKISLEGLTTQTDVPQKKIRSKRQIQPH